MGPAVSVRAESLHDPSYTSGVGCRCEGCVAAGPDTRCTNTLPGSRSRSHIGRGRMWVKEMHGTCAVRSLVVPLLTVLVLAAPREVLTDSGVALVVGKSIQAYIGMLPNREKLGHHLEPQPRTAGSDISLALCSAHSIATHRVNTSRSAGRASRGVSERRQIDEET